MRSRCNEPLIPFRPCLTVLSVLFSLMLSGCGGSESNVVSGNRDGVLHYRYGAHRRAAAESDDNTMPR